MFSSNPYFIVLRRMIGLIYCHFYDEFEYHKRKFRMTPLRKCKPIKEGKVRITEIKMND